MSEIKKNTHGGSRGGGRPKGKIANHTMDAIEARKLLVKMVSENLTPILQAQIALATGIKVITEDGDIYEQKPDHNAAKMLIDQAIGRAKESVEFVNPLQLDSKEQEKANDLIAKVLYGTRNRKSSEKK